MGFQSDYNEYDYEFSCPECGSGQVVISEDEYGYMRIVICKKCGYTKKENGN